MAPQEHIPPAASILGTIGTAAVPFGIYNIVQNFNIPLQVQPQVFCALTLICWAQTLIYHDHWRVWTASLAAIITGLVSGGVEALLILTLRGPYSRGVEWPIVTIGVIAAVLLAVGLLPMYWEQWKRNGRAKDISIVPLRPLTSFADIVG
ncbi:hypothetical protein SLS57_003306 [Botryosphaeria dothidea]